MFVSAVLWGGTHGVLGNFGHFHGLGGRNQRQVVSWPRLPTFLLYLSKCKLSCHIRSTCGDFLHYGYSMEENTDNIHFPFLPPSLSPAPKIQVWGQTILIGIDDEQSGFPFLMAFGRFLLRFLSSVHKHKSNEWEIRYSASNSCIRASKLHTPFSKYVP